MERRPKTTKNEHFQDCLFFFKRNSSYFLRCFITVGETCIHDYTTEWKQQSNHIGMVGESARRKAKRVQSTGKSWLRFSGIHKGWCLQTSRKKA